MIATGLCMKGTGLAQAAKKQDFSGTWVLNMHKSKLGLPAVPVGSTWVIQHREPEFHLERTDTYRSGVHHTRKIDLVTDGKQETVQQDGPYRLATRMHWKGNVLVLDTKITTSDGSEGTTVIRFNLSPNGNTLTAIEQDENPGGKWGARWVFDRQKKIAVSRHKIG